MQIVEAAGQLGLHGGAANLTKFAVQDLFEVIFESVNDLFVPEQLPDHDEKLYPDAGAAVRVFDPPYATVPAPLTEPLPAMLAVAETVYIGAVK